MFAKCKSKMFAADFRMFGEILYQAVAFLEFFILIVLLISLVFAV